MVRREVGRVTREVKRVERVGKRKPLRVMKRIMITTRLQCNC